MSERIKVALVRTTCISELVVGAVGAVRFGWKGRKVRFNLLSSSSLNVSRQLEYWRHSRKECCQISSLAVQMLFWMHRKAGEANVCD